MALSPESERKILANVFDGTPIFMEKIQPCVWERVSELKCDKRKSIAVNIYNKTTTIDEAKKYIQG